MIRILGLDPGLQKTGWGLICMSGNKLSYGNHGVIKSDPALALSQRLAQLHDGISAVIKDHTPHEAAVEETFMNNNASSALKLGMARGVVLLLPALYGIPVGEYAANRIKKAVVGVGHADKTQVATMVQRLLVGCGVVTGDAADALAVAICHAGYATARSYKS